MTKKQTPRKITDRTPPKSLPLKGQGRSFAEAARELGCDESEAAFDARLQMLARQKPAQNKTSK